MFEIYGEIIKKSVKKYILNFMISLFAGLSFVPITDWNRLVVTWAEIAIIICEIVVKQCANRSTHEPTAR
jgi:hypothetical protein